jgi:outer membrane immunogenic protein
MKRLVIAGALAFAAAGPALAADLPQPGPPPPQAPVAYVPTVAPVYNWGGIYFGVNGGYDYTYSTWNNSLGASTGSFHPGGFLIGGTLGANFQYGAWVFGLEGDIDWTNVTGNSSAGPCVGITCTTAQNYLGTIRGRAGYAWDRVLFFLTAGGAFGNINAGATTLGTQNFNNFGWTAGGGIEFAVAQNWTAKVEYLYVSLGNASCTTACIVPLASAATGSTVSLSENLIRAGVNYKFSF